MIDITVMEESFVSWKERKEWKEWMERAVVGGVDSVDGVSSSGRVSELRPECAVCPARGPSQAPSAQFAVFNAPVIWDPSLSLSSPGATIVAPSL